MATMTPQPLTVGALPLPATTTVPAHPSPKTTSILDEYTVTGRMLGSGLSGPVVEIAHRATARLYALKILPNNAKSRREISLQQRCCPSRYVVQIVEVFENMWKGTVQLLIVLEHMAGGELFARIQSKAESGFTEQEAATLVQTMALAIAHIHSVNVAHRDLKPENFLFTDESESAQLKMIDFGFAKDCSEQLRTPVFTPYYAAPEVLRCRAQQSPAYDRACDLWSLGVIVYIIVAGSPPFYSYSQQQHAMLTPGMARRIQTGDYEFEEDIWRRVAPDATELVRHLLVPDPTNRIALTEVLRHPWLTQKAKASGVLLPSPQGLATSASLWAEAQGELSCALTQMRIEGTTNMASLDLSKSNLLARRKHTDSQQSDDSATSLDDGHTCAAPPAVAQLDNDPFASPIEAVSSSATMSSACTSAPQFAVPVVLHNGSGSSSSTASNGEGGALAMAGNSEQSS